MAMTVHYLSFGARIWMWKKQPTSRQSFNIYETVLFAFYVQADFMSVLHIVNKNDSGKFNFAFQKGRQELKFQWQVY